MTINVCSLNGEYEVGRVRALRHFFRAFVHRAKTPEHETPEHESNFESDVIGVTINLNGRLFYQALEFKDDVIPLVGVKLLSIG